MAPITKTVKLSNLLLNTENYRFEPLGSQKEAIDKMIEDQGDNLYNIAEHILENGFNPHDEILVIASNQDPKKFIVLEGNRRTTSVKLLHNPELIEKNASLKKKFRKLHDDNISKLITAIEVSVYDDPKEAEKWIGIKHGYGGNGINTDSWGTLPKERYAERTEGKTSTTLQVINLLKKSPDVDVKIKDDLENITATNLNRVISDPYVRDFLGIRLNNGEIESDIEEKEVIKGLTQIVKDNLNPKFTVAQIYTKEDRKNYVDGFAKKHKPDTTKKTKPWQFTAKASSTKLPKSASKAKTSANPKERTRLIPKACVLNISNAKVNKIYHELQGLDVDTYTNAAAVLFRVFVELSVDTYLEEHKLITTPSAAGSGLNLQQKVNNVASHLENKKNADAAICKGIKAEIKDSNGLLGINTWHAYVHNNKFQPKTANLIITWDNIQEFMVILWNNIK